MIIQVTKYLPDITHSEDW